MHFPGTNFQTGQGLTDGETLTWMNVLFKIRLDFPILESDTTGRGWRDLGEWH